MKRFRYGQNNKFYFTCLSSINNNKIIAKLHWETSVSVNYKDYVHLCISCDKGPEICEGETICATEIDSGENIKFVVKKIFHNYDTNNWLIELEK